MLSVSDQILVHGNKLFTCLMKRLGKTALYQKCIHEVNTSLTTQIKGHENSE